MPAAYIDNMGYPRSADGSLYIEIGGNGGGGFSYDPVYDEKFLDFIDGTPIDWSSLTLPNITIGGPYNTLPGQIALPGIGGLFTSIEKATGLPAWLVIALAAGGAFLVFKKLGG